MMKWRLEKISISYKHRERSYEGLSYLLTQLKDLSKYRRKIN